MRARKAGPRTAARSGASTPSDPPGGGITVRGRIHAPAALVGVAFTILLAACSPASPSPAATDSPAGPTSGSPPPESPVTGAVIDIDSAGITEIRGFTVRLPGGATLSFRIGTLENVTEFPPEHLPEHRASGEPVRVFFRAQGDALVVDRIEDAGG